LVVWVDQLHFAKLCYEQSHRGEATVVSVVTRGVSDDANGWTDPGPSLWLRVSHLRSGAYAFHACGEDRDWDLVRYFDLDNDRPARFGLAAQSPTGSGCTVDFAEVALTPADLPDIRDGT
jgi:regulation of enolase protein 1 (concanavalin A-like superfamily)